MILQQKGPTPDRDPLVVAAVGQSVRTAMAVPNAEGERLIGSFSVYRQEVEQPRILDSDDCLSSKVFNQFDLLIGKGANFLSRK